MNTPESASPSAKPFHLLWTIGFSGKRHLAPAAEAAVGQALRQVLAEFIAEAAVQNARLTAISSLARGGDVLFAEAAQDTAMRGGPLPWKCLLPFAWEGFIQQDLAADAAGKALDPEEHAKRKRRALACRNRSLPAPEITSCGADPADKEQRDEAYLECGYRTVDESDVMIFLLLAGEYERVKALAGQPQGDGSPPRGAGTLPVACYALAAGRPVVLLNAEADDVAASCCRVTADADLDTGQSWFVDPMVTSIVQQGNRLAAASEKVRQETATDLSGPETAARAGVTLAGAQMGALANQHQGQTQNGLRWVLRFHLAASALAAVGATVLHVADPDGKPWALLVALLLLALCKPALVFAAWWLERRLHRDGTRELWLHARVLAELCRGALSTWPLPQQPLDAQDEEDFPKVKRLIRTLRLLREQDPAAAVQGTTREPGETQLEADMRAACEVYSRKRLEDQAGYYERQLGKALRQERNWRRAFQSATWTAIVVGLVLVLDRFFLAGGGQLLGGPFERLLEAIIIIAPFLEWTNRHMQRTASSAFSSPRPSGT
jgi:hypothetical protein